MPIFSMAVSLDAPLPTRRARGTEPTSERRAQVERDVLRAVDDLLQDGARWTDLSIERIARAAGLSRTAFYFYFPDKREVLLRLIQEVWHDIFEQAAWLNGSAAARDTIPAAVHEVHGIYQEHGALLQAIVEVSAVDEAIAEIYRGYLDAFAASAAARIAGLQAAGEAAPLTPAHATATALVAMTERAFYLWRIRGEEVTPEHTSAIAGIWIRAVYGPA